eukprot:CAMPEP_0173466788 /NCGR_PEP_ID=MMETSP1357-20121228/73942_1 /TAXON_ID=77926 /ORGANISM="Hemiselmis rufescens, Strain PCC563" /LENGTH=142 /DNA_ID=CAMNT_0014434873 /DNA_START=57 /DNA_END=485 /DNA_ORIENTATION=+
MPPHQTAQTSKHAHEGNHRCIECQPLRPSRLGIASQPRRHPPSMCERHCSDHTDGKPAHLEGVQRRVEERSPEDYAEELVKVSSKRDGGGRSKLGQRDVAHAERATPKTSRHDGCPGPSICPLKKRQGPLPRVPPKRHQDRQ